MPTVRVELNIETSFSFSAHLYQFYRKPRIGSFKLVSSCKTNVKTQSLQELVRTQNFNQHPRHDRCRWASSETIVSLTNDLVLRDFGISVLYQFLCILQSFRNSLSRKRTWFKLHDCRQRLFKTRSKVLHARTMHNTPPKVMNWWLSRSW